MISVRDGHYQTPLEMCISVGLECAWLCPNCARQGQIIKNNSKRNQK